MRDHSNQNVRCSRAQFQTHVRKIAEQEIENRRQGISFLLYMSVSKTVGGWWTENNWGQVLLIEHAKILTGNSKLRPDP